MDMLGLSALQKSMCQEDTRVGRPRGRRSILDVEPCRALVVSALAPEDALSGNTELYVRGGGDSAALTLVPRSE